MRALDSLLRAHRAASGMSPSLCGYGGERHARQQGEPLPEGQRVGA